MHTNNTREKEIAEAEATVARLENAQYCASMSNGRYYTDGSKARDDAAISEAKTRLADLMRGQEFRS